MGKKGDFSDFEQGMVVGARKAGLISKTADILGFSSTTISSLKKTHLILTWRQEKEGKNHDDLKEEMFLIMTSIQ